MEQITGDKILKSGVNDIIYLVPMNDFDEYCWCDNPTIVPGMDEEDSIKYIKAAKYDELKRAICIYAREKLGGIDFESDTECIDYFVNFGNSFKR